MAQYVVWLDSVKAQIFNLTPEGVVKTHLEKTEVDHHTHSKKDVEVDTGTEHFFHGLCAKFADAEEILLLGPGLAKTHFKTYLEKHQPSGLAKKIIGIENSDHPTDNQILAEARRFFKTYNLFQQPI